MFCLWLRLLFKQTWVFIHSNKKHKRLVKYQQNYSAIICGLDNIKPELI